MTPAPLYEVDALTVIEFTEALARLQAQLGQEVRLLVNFHVQLERLAKEGEAFGGVGGTYSLDMP